MVPISTGNSTFDGGDDSCIAYFTEGKLKHTNEILVHLGANYFV